MAIRNINRDGYIGLTPDEMTQILQAMKDAHEIVHTGSDRIALDTLIGRFVRLGTHLTEKEYGILLKLEPSMPQLEFIDAEAVPQRELSRMKQFGQKAAATRQKILEDLFDDREAFQNLMLRRGVLDAKTGPKSAGALAASLAPSAPPMHDHGSANREAIEHSEERILEAVQGLVEIHNRTRTDTMIRFDEEARKREKELMNYIAEQRSEIITYREALRRLFELIDGIGASGTAIDETRSSAQPISIETLRDGLRERQKAGNDSAPRRAETS